jgi:hypothetical protein
MSKRREPNLTTVADTLRRIGGGGWHISYFAGDCYGTSRDYGGGLYDVIAPEVLEAMVAQGYATRTPNGDRGAWFYELTHEGRREAARLYWGF